MPNTPADPTATAANESQKEDSLTPLTFERRFDLTLDECKQFIKENNAAMSAQIGQDLENRMRSIITETVDKRFAEHEANLFAKIEALQKRTEKLEKRATEHNAWANSGFVPQPGSSSARETSNKR